MLYLIFYEKIWLIEIKCLPLHQIKKNNNYGRKKRKVYDFGELKRNTP